MALAAKKSREAPPPREGHLDVSAAAAALRIREAQLTVGVAERKSATASAPDFTAESEDLGPKIKVALPQTEEASAAAKTPVVSSPPIGPDGIPLVIGPDGIPLIQPR